VGIRPGEKVHETLVSEEEAHRTVERAGYYVILPMLPELTRNENELQLHSLAKEYSSADHVMSPDETNWLLQSNGLMPENMPHESVEVLR
jgi:UDP-glucose 4-epimerase